MGHTDHFSNKAQVVSDVLSALSHDDDELFCGMVDLGKAFTPYFQPEPLSEILTIVNLRHGASRV